jgi:hypothetical protein
MAPDPVLIVRAAIQAHGGEAALRGVAQLHVHSRLDCAGISFASDVFWSGPQRFRQVVDAGDAIMTHGCAGEKTFARLDDLDVELTESEQRELLQQPQLMRPDWLLDVLNPDRFKLDVGPSPAAKPGEQLVRARALEDGAEFLLHFDASTHLLSAMTRSAGSVQRTLEFSDFRPVRQVLMPWCARWMNPGALHAVNTFVRVDTPASLADELFTAPPSTAPTSPRLVRGTSPATLALRVAASEWEDGKQAIEAHLRASGLQRSGPFAGEVSEGKLCFMSLPIAARPVFEPTGPLLPEAVCLIERAPFRHQRRAVRAENCPAALVALAALAAESTAAGVPPSAQRVVQWNANYWILQMETEP